MNSRLRELRKRHLLAQEELAEKVEVSVVTVGRWEAGQRPQPLHLRRLSEVLGATAEDLGFHIELPAPLRTIALDDDLPDLEEVQGATLRLRRSYSTTRPEELRRRIDERLRQIRELLVRGRPDWRGDLLESAAWLTLLRSTVLADARNYESAYSAVHGARQLAQELGHGEIEAWTWETEAWMAATDNRQCEALELAGVGISRAPQGSHSLVAATLQRACINGASGDLRATLRDLAAGERALAQTPLSAWNDDHYVIDPSKAAFFASGALAALHLPKETIEHAAEVVRSSLDPGSRGYWPMRVANARLEWAMALADRGEEDEAYALALQALERQWFRPDTESRTRMLLRRLRDPRLRALLAGELEERLTG
jgi:transcriptional regulator with XRE-family HTH domain